MSISEDGEAEVNFGSRDKYINEPFDRLTAEVNFGNFNLYMADMEVQGQKMQLEVDVNFSTMKIYLPQGWQVELDVDNVFSSVTGLKQTQHAVTVLRVTGDVNFSSLEIAYV